MMKCYTFQLMLNGKDLSVCMEIHHSTKSVKMVGAHNCVTDHYSFGSLLYLFIFLFVEKSQ